MRPVVAVLTSAATVTIRSCRSPRSVRPAPGNPFRYPLVAPTGARAVTFET